MQPTQFLDKLSTHLKNTIGRAMTVAANVQSSTVTPLHLLFALAEEKGSVGAEILKKVGCNAEHVLDVMKRRERHEKKMRPDTYNTLMAIELNAHAKKVIEKAVLVAYEHGHTYVGTEHLLHALLQEGDDYLHECIAKLHIRIADILEQVNTIFTNTSHFPAVEDLSNAIDEVREHAHHSPEGTVAKEKKKKRSAPSLPSALEFFTTNLTDPSVQKTIDPVVGREKEIDRMVHILARRKKNNPLLVGEPGVGKTAIVEGLAKRILEGDVPMHVRGKKLLALDLPLLIAGTIYRGEFEGRLKQLIDEIADRPDILLFIDEIHNLVGAGSNSGTMDAANILKPALARGVIHCIGATTIDEHKRYIQTDPALERRFQCIDVAEPTVEETIRILSGVAKNYETFHSITIDESAIQGAVTLSTKYIHDHYLPDKAIDLLDEASALVASAHATDDTDVVLRGLMGEKEAYEKQKTQAIRGEHLEDAIRWKEKIETAEKAIAKLTRVKHGKKRRSVATVREADVARVLADRLGVREEQLMSSDWDRIAAIRSTLLAHIIGEDHVIDGVVTTLQQSSLGLSTRPRPRASFLFVGPSGVGKTELAKILARELFLDPDTCIRLDMSEFSEGHAVSKLLGSPAGYVGYKDRNSFIERIRKHPHALIIFDEIDKAHPDVRRLLLQILDEGELTDSSGKKILFHHNVIVLTSNIGAEYYKQAGLGFSEESSIGSRPHLFRDELILDKIREELGQSLLARIDRVCIFSPFETKDIHAIIEKQSALLLQALGATIPLPMRVHKSAIEAISKEGYTIDTGARHIERTIARALHEAVHFYKERPMKKEKVTLQKKDGRFRFV